MLSLEKPATARHEEVNWGVVLLKLSHAEVVMDWDAIDLVQAVFESYCAEVGCHPESVDGREIAEALTNFFKRGYVTGDELKHAIAGHQLVLKASY